MSPRLALLEVLERDGRVRSAVPVAAWPLRVGRAIDNDVVLDDPHVAPYHLQVAPDDTGALVLQVLPGVNGIGWGKQRLAPGATLALPTAPRPEMLVGHTRLRLRLVGDPLPAERALPQRGRHGQTATVALVLWAWLLAAHAIDLDPGSKAGDWLRPLLGAPGAVAAWCGVWALASKIFQHRFDFWPHVAVAVRGLLAVEVLSAALPWLAGILGWVGPARIAVGVVGAVGVLTLVAHAWLVLPQHRRALAAAGLAAYAAGSAIVLGLNQQRHERWFAELYSSRLPPPGLQWHRAVPASEFVAATSRLQPALQRSTAEAAAEEKAGAAAEDEE